MGPKPSKTAIKLYESMKNMGFTGQQKFQFLVYNSMRLKLKEVKNEKKNQEMLKNYAM